MEKRFSEENKVTSDDVLKIIADYRNCSNKDLEKALGFVKLDFDNTKDHLIKMTKHLDRLEITYNKLLKEFNSRNGK